MSRAILPQIPLRGNEVFVPESERGRQVFMRLSPWVVPIVVKHFAMSQAASSPESKPGHFCSGWRESGGSQRRRVGIVTMIRVINHDTSWFCRRDGFGNATNLLLISPRVQHHLHVMAMMAILREGGCESFHESC